MINTMCGGRRENFIMSAVEFLIITCITAVMKDDISE
jgi:hypothetical protein